MINPYTDASESSELSFICTVTNIYQSITYSTTSSTGDELQAHIEVVSHCPYMSMNQVLTG